MTTPDDTVTLVSSALVAVTATSVCSDDGGGPTVTAPSVRTSLGSTRTSVVAPGVVVVSDSSVLFTTDSIRSNIEIGVVEVAASFAVVVVSSVTAATTGISLVVSG